MATRTYKIAMEKDGPEIEATFSRTYKRDELDIMIKDMEKVLAYLQSERDNMKGSSNG